MKRELIREKYMFETTEDEKKIISGALQSAILFYLKKDSPVYLEEFGILTPKKSRANRTYIIGQQTLVRSEKIMSLDFHKCSELTTYHREKFGNIIETKDLCATVMAFIEPQHSLQWPEEKLRSYIKGLIEAIKHEAVTLGFSARLEDIGTFYCLHNRQGMKFNDWFAGADIFIKSKFNQTYKVDKTQSFERIVLNDGLELIEAINGPIVDRFELNLKKELTKLGYEISESEEFREIIKHKIEIAVFFNSAKNTYLFCSNGMRNLAISKKESSNGNEIIFQISKDELEASGFNRKKRITPAWVKTLYTIVWIVTSGSKSKTLKIGSGISLEAPITGSAYPSKICAFFSTRYSKVKNQQLCPEGTFDYVNIVGLTEDEVRIAQDYSPAHLQSLIEHKKLDQITKISRSSIVKRSSFFNVSSDKQPQVEKSKPVSQPETYISTAESDAANIVIN